MIVRIFPVVVILVSLTTGVLGVLPWPFSSKRFTANAFVDAGTLGLEDAGRIVAFGDFDGNQLSVTTYSSNQTLTIQLPLQSRRRDPWIRTEHPSHIHLVTFPLPVHQEQHPPESTWP
jgi:hypothetical protein